ncbi:MAG: hypothetical protein GY712_14055 [Oceanicoccus sp.]|uniref:hypothetical protein n=1 Tax=Oceanicoccus sp. TaxID=2691044 RepID=UPI002610732F|nr:hypothetical protein [Oceanicoccus sp.]MCP3909127.1 hypothetical protein [Oceanicoccus sp.]
MNKAFSKYGKQQWIKTRLSKPYKARRAISIASTAAHIQTSLAHARLISQAPAKTSKEKALKSIAMAKCVMSAFEQIKKPL